MRPILKKLSFVVLGLLISALIFFISAYKKQPTPAVVAQPLESRQKPDITKEASIEPVLPAEPVPETIPTGQKVIVPVLMYHRIGVPPDPAADDLTVSVADFETQVQYFISLGYHSVTLAQVYDALVNNGSLPSKPIVFTFDDGFKDAFENAIPILKKYGYTGTFAIATELLSRPTYAVWDDVIAARNAGMEIVSHTENHLDLTNPIYSETDLRREIFDSKSILENKLGSSVDFFIYPYGHYNSHVQELVSQAGYKMAFTTAYGQYLGQNDLLAEPRVRVHGQDGLDRLKKIFSPGPRNATALLSP